MLPAIIADLANTKYGKRDPTKSVIGCTLVSWWRDRSLSMTAKSVWQGREIALQPTPMNSKDLVPGKATVDGNAIETSRSRLVTYKGADE